MKVFILLGAINMFVSIALGAFGAHGLEGKVSERMLSNWQTGAQYHMIHALGLLFVGLLAGRIGTNPLVTNGGWLLLAGIILFSGSLYIMALTNITKLGMITPFGGVSFLIGWTLIATAAVKEL
ncbi:MAG: DUF423 domain-containing protein [Firmicutes bacterium]|uniref:Uncharacterized membrane protein YgdD, TMEM256/DUF423 family n=1 Tax=Melghirimyces thermohalophilus TaxID=1236220 RepID=A0A1G6N8L5_9BACL|nr:DUF423 domain-containing protein [Melghirimyces thermohalophilus]MDA8352085.1 DUF423 domain-containing protein [Bacillota bacterium]SDC64031.1 Uncharacterized membrane protein YgdD, TMEM256/DUF423 family [Melghirimyces thermohalophilus]